MQLYGNFEEITMKRTGKLTGLLCAAAILLCPGCNSAPQNTAAPVTAAASSSDTAAPTAEISAAQAAEDTSPAPALTAESIVSSMTLEQKIAQMIIMTYRYWTDDDGNADASHNVTSLNDKQKALITKYDFGGICLYNSNISDTEQTVRLTAEIQAAAAESEHGIPLLITIDQEGGEITRIAKGTKTCGNMALGAVGDAQAAYENAVIIGSELSALGINTDFAPDVDVNNDPANPVINVRSFSSEPELVAKLGTAYIEGLESKGIISTVKHFPGHGDTGIDSHSGLPVIDKSLDELKKLELVPFAAVSDAADMVMTAHIQFPQIAKETYTSKSTGESMILPATLSKTIIKGILRGDMGYDGVVTTDSMLMDAIDANFGQTEAAILAINADVDIILEPLFIADEESIGYMEDYISALADAVREGRIAESEIDDSVIRIVSLKLEKGLFGSVPSDIADAASSAKTIVGSKEHHDKELETAERAITLIKNDDSTLPLRLTENEKVAYFYPFSGGENAMTFALERLKAEGVIPGNAAAECHCMTENSPSSDYDGLINDVRSYEELVRSSAAVIIAAETYRRENMDRTDPKRAWQAVFTDEMTALAHKNGVKVVFLSMHMPYDAVRYSEADAILCAYCGQDMPSVPTEYNGDTTAYGVNYPAALITVFGGSSPTGTLPVDLPEYIEGTGYTDEIVYPFGFGLNY